MNRKNKADNPFWSSALLNNRTYSMYYYQLLELALSRFEWINLPPSVDPRYMELTLLTNGMSVFFRDDVLGFLALQAAVNGPLNVYNIPIERRAYANNGYNKVLNSEDSVIVYNNYTRTPSVEELQLTAYRLYMIERAIDINVTAQKTPTLIKCDEEQRLTMVNLFKEYEGNIPFIFGNKSLNTEGIETFPLTAPYVADKLFDLKTQIWNEQLTRLGISNLNITKKERLITDEVTKNQGATVANRASYLSARQEACKQINAMFELNIQCEFRPDYQLLEPIEDNQEETGGDNVE